MPTDLTGTPTSLGIGTYNVDADAPSGLGFNEAMAQIDTLLGARVATPGGIVNGQSLLWNGTTWTVYTPKPPTKQVFTSGSGTYTTPAGAKAILVECVGGGAGGGGAGPGGNGLGAVCAGGGGGAGGYARTLIQGPAATYDYVVGAGGTAGDATPTNGGNGGDTYFTTHGGGLGAALCKGGGAGYGVAGGATYSNFERTSGGIGGGSNIGDVTVVGGQGDYGFAITGGSGSNIRVSKGGMGGSSAFGGGGMGVVGNPGTNATAGAGQAYGSGGGGAAGLDGGWGTAGAGAGGLIVITEFYL